MLGQEIQINDVPVLFLVIHSYMHDERDVNANIFLGTLCTGPPHRRNSSYLFLAGSSHPHLPPASPLHLLFSPQHLLLAQGAFWQQFAVSVAM